MNKLNLFLVVFCFSRVNSTIISTMYTFSSPNCDPGTKLFAMSLGKESGELFDTCKQVECHKSKMVGSGYSTQIKCHQKPFVSFDNQPFLKTEQFHDLECNDLKSISGAALEQCFSMRPEETGASSQYISCATGNPVFYVYNNPYCNGEPVKKNEAVDGECRRGVRLSCSQ
jgi:hypothetical protein